LAVRDPSGGHEAPWCGNLTVHRSNPRMRDDLVVLLRHTPEIVITSVGSPAEVVRPLHDGGALVFSDVASVRHAERAIEVGADGLILLTAGAGGQTGWLSPFAFVRAVRRFYDGLLVLAGGIGDGQALGAAVIGMRFGVHGHAVHRHNREPGPTGLLVSSNADDVLQTRAFTGLQTNRCRKDLATWSRGWRLRPRVKPVL
jgi:nitronate monooxygenase